MSLTIPLNYSLYDLPYGDEFPVQQMFVTNFKLLPSLHEATSQTYSINVLEYFSENGFEKISQIISKGKRSNQIQQFFYVNEKKQIFIVAYSTDNKKDKDLVTLRFYYSTNNGEFKTQFDVSEISKYEKTKEKSNISLIRSDMGHLSTDDYDLVIPPMNIELNYGSKFKPIHETIIHNLNKNYGKGIILLHGDPGTGKTSYIKYLTSLITDKEVLFVPPSMVEMLSDPSIIPFLMDHKNSVLVIEDAERVIADRETNGSSAGVSNILNLTDGILGDCLNIQVVATFNMKREKIDTALLRKGRLIAEHKFESLPVEETNKLLTYLNKDYVSKTPMCLADIYNIDVEVHKTETKNKIGLF